MEAYFPTPGFSFIIGVTPAASVTIVETLSESTINLTFSLRADSTVSSFFKICAFPTKYLSADSLTTFILSASALATIFIASALPSN